VTFTSFEPDPSVAAPADVIELVFAHAAPLPVAADFPILSCDVRDQFADVIAGASCVVTAIEPLQ